MAEASLSLTGLRIQAGSRVLVEEATLRLQAGRMLALVGESGSGKTLTARACLGLLELRPGVVGGSLEVQVGARTLRPFEGAPRERERSWAELRGAILGWIPQEARGSLDPLRAVGAQLERVLPLPGGGQGGPPGDVGHWLRRAGLAEAAHVAGMFPHELSGGMARRVCIALALARGSRFIVADEPTTGLDPTVQAEILDALGALRAQGCGLLLITHDLRIVPALADEVALMHAGRLVETLPAARLAELRSEAGQRLLAATRPVAGGLW